MTIDRDIKYHISLANELRSLPKEIEWIEFKHNNDNPEEIGEYISSLSNSAALNRKAYAYLLWGIDSESHDIIGTTFTPDMKKVGNEELENWLLRLLKPRINFHFFEIPVEDKRLILLEISRAFRHPVQFKGIEYIRIGSYQKKLKDFPEKERELWRIFDDTPFENYIAAEKLSDEEVIKLLDYPAYFDRLGQIIPETRSSILEALERDSMIIRSDSSHWNVSNLGAVLLAKNLSDFGSLKRKAVRVIFYRADGRTETIREQEGVKGFARGFEGLIEFINNLLPSNEIVGQAIRKVVPMYPELAVRELVANAIIHQDFFITGAGPMIEIFKDRMEITNPGKPLVETTRFLNTPPLSRNEALASFMRRIGICEERGSGVDKVVSQTELYQLPAPIFEVVENSTRAILFAHRELKNMDRADRIRACYLHACLKYENRNYMTNSSLRDRFGIEQRNAAMASKIIKETMDARMIRPFDKNASRKYMKYVPFWA
jgi:ATP-dependent DNA helicase RecG